MIVGQVRRHQRPDGRQGLPQQHVAPLAAREGVGVGGGVGRRQQVDRLRIEQGLESHRDGAAALADRHGVGRRHRRNHVQRRHRQRDGRERSRSTGRGLRRDGVRKRGGGVRQRRSCRSESRGRVRLHGRDIGRECFVAGRDRHRANRLSTNDASRSLRDRSFARLRHPHTSPSSQTNPPQTATVPPTASSATIGVASLIGSSG